MSLKNRLRTLRQQSGRASSDISSQRNSLAERVQRLRPGGLSASDSRSVSANRSTPAEVAQAVEGKLIAPHLVLVEDRIPLQGEHGRFPLQRLQAGVNLPDYDGDSLEGLLFIDTETTGLAGGAGTLAFMLGLARVRAGALELRQLLLTGFADEAAFLQVGAEWVTEAMAFVSFNGKSFDLPLLAGRCRLAGVGDPYSPLPHVDLLYPTRRAYASRWADCRLSTAERQLLGFVRRNDLPGSEAPAAWFDYVHHGDASRLPDVARHNRWDLVSLAALLPRLAEVHVQPGRWEADTQAIARFYAKQGDEDRAREILESHAEVLDEAGLLFLAALYRRDENWPSACTIWESLSDRGCAESLERLAKYHEHVCRDYETALSLTNRLPECDESRRRRRRLERKASRRA